MPAKPPNSSPPSEPAASSGRIHRQALAGLEVLEQIRGAVHEGQPADQALSALYREHREFGSRDRRLFSALVFSWFRWKGWLQHLEDKASQVVVAYSLDAGEAHPVIDFIHAESPIRELSLRPLGGESLETKAAQLAEWFTDIAFSPDTLLPEWVAPALPEEPALVSTFIEACQKRPPVWIRALKSSSGNLEGYLDKNELHFEKSKAITNAFAIHNPAEATQLKQKHGDWFEIQDLASQCVGHIAAPRPGQSWWDVCCGSGGKTLHLADLMNGQGFMQATDNRRHVLREFYRRSKPYGDLPLRIVRQDILQAPRPQKKFDGVLVDAPCSGLGTWPRHPDARWRARAKQIEQYAAVQRLILNRVAGWVEPNGILVYAVCTLTRLETEDVMNAFLKEHADFQPDPFMHPITRVKTPGWARIFPANQQGGAMFVARLRKSAE